MHDYGRLGKTTAELQMAGSPGRELPCARPAVTAKNSQQSLPLPRSLTPRLPHSRCRAFPRRNLCGGFSRGLPPVSVYVWTARGQYIFRVYPHLASYRYRFHQTQCGSRGMPRGGLRSPRGLTRARVAAPARHQAPRPACSAPRPRKTPVVTMRPGRDGASLPRGARAADGAARAVRVVTAAAGT
jgi:hypothetical protein